MGPEPSPRLALLGLLRRSEHTKLHFALHHVVLATFDVLIQMGSIDVVLAYLQLDPAAFSQRIGEGRERRPNRREVRPIVFICELVYVRVRLLVLSRCVLATRLDVHLLRGLAG